MRIGDLGVDRSHEELEPLDFGYFGETIRVAPTYTDAEILDFIDGATRVDLADPRSLLFVKDAMRRAIHPKDFDLFWRTASENRQTVEDRMTILKAITEAVGNRPTQRSSDSSAGPSTTPAKSGDDSSSRVLSRLDGRPDLQLLVHDTATARAAAGQLSVAS